MKNIKKLVNAIDMKFRRQRLVEWLRVAKDPKNLELGKDEYIELFFNLPLKNDELMDHYIFYLYFSNVKYDQSVIMECIEYLNFFILRRIGIVTSIALMHPVIIDQRCLTDTENISETDPEKCAAIFLKNKIDMFPEILEKIILSYTKDITMPEKVFEELKCILFDFSYFSYKPANISELFQIISECTPNSIEIETCHKVIKEKNVSNYTLLGLMIKSLFTREIDKPLPKSIFQDFVYHSTLALYRHLCNTSNPETKKLFLNFLRPKIINTIPASIYEDYKNLYSLETDGSTLKKLHTYFDFQMANFLIRREENIVREKLVNFLMDTVSCNYKSLKKFAMSKCKAWDAFYERLGESVERCFFNDGIKFTELRAFNKETKTWVLTKKGELRFNEIRPQIDEIVAHTETCRRNVKFHIRINEFQKINELIIKYHQWLIDFLPPRDERHEHQIMSELQTFISFEGETPLKVEIRKHIDFLMQEKVMNAKIKWQLQGLSLRKFQYTEELNPEREMENILASLRMKARRNTFSYIKTDVLGTIRYMVIYADDLYKITKNFASNRFLGDPKIKETIQAFEKLKQAVNDQKIPHINPEFLGEFIVSKCEQVIYDNSKIIYEKNKTFFNLLQSFKNPHKQKIFLILFMDFLNDDDLLLRDLKDADEFFESSSSLAIKPFEIMLKKISVLASDDMKSIKVFEDIAENRTGLIISKILEKMIIVSARQITLLEDHNEKISKAVDGKELLDILKLNVLSDVKLDPKLLKILPNSPHDLKLPVFLITSPLCNGNFKTLTDKAILEQRNKIMEEFSGFDEVDLQNSVFKKIVLKKIENMTSYELTKLILKKSSTYQKILPKYSAIETRDKLLTEINNVRGQFNNLIITLTPAVKSHLQELFLGKDDLSYLDISELQKRASEIEFGVRVITETHKRKRVDLLAAATSSTQHISDEDIEYMNVKRFAYSERWTAETPKKIKTIYDSRFFICNELKKLINYQEKLFEYKKNTMEKILGFESDAEQMSQYEQQFEVTEDSNLDEMQTTAEETFAYVLSAKKEYETLYSACKINFDETMTALDAEITKIQQDISFALDENSADREFYHEIMSSFIEFTEEGTKIIRIFASNLENAVLDLSKSKTMAIFNEIEAKKVQRAAAVQPQLTVVQQCADLDLDTL